MSIGKEWIPGVLSRAQVAQLASEGFLENVDASAIDPSAFDLHLTAEGYELTAGSVKPFGDRYLHRIKKDGLVRELEATDGVFCLRRNKTYLFKVNESLRLDRFGRAIHGQATAKSSVGRVDVLARLIVDGMSDYERFDPEGMESDMFVEITPITFDVCVRPGIALTQLRLFLGDPDDVEIRNEELYRTCLDAGAPFLSVDLEPTEIGGLHAAAFATSVSETNQPVNLWESDSSPEPWRYWRILRADGLKRLKIEKEAFYILRSKEKIALPPGVCVYCRASDETIGEMRIHYAGFVHPHFGRNRQQGIGTPLIFEVRGHNVDVSLIHGERMAKLTFYRMSQDAEPGQKSAYGDQSLELSKFFKHWPARLEQLDATGRVQPAA